MPSRLREIAEENKRKVSERRKRRSEKVEDRRNYRLEKITALTQKFYAVAAKRKWLVFLIGVALIAYLVISSGGIGFGGIIEKVKSFFSFFRS